MPNRSPYCECSALKEKDEEMCHECRKIKKIKTFTGIIDKGNRVGKKRSAGDALSLMGNYMKYNSSQI